jgi:Grx4 family monothiol glutaredoxin
MNTESKTTVVQEVSSVNDLTTESNQKSVLFFWAAWHEATTPSGSASLVFETLAQSIPSISFYRVEAEAQPEISAKYKIQVVPSFVLLHGETVVEIIAGIDDVSKLTQAVSKLRNRDGDNISSSSSSQIDASSEMTSNISTAEENLHKKLKELTHKSTVMLFMKGTPNQPRCGFSRQAVELLQQANIPFGSFDILANEEVRQGLKTFSNWPTYPQCYVNGELVGGLDILKEMNEEGNLAEQLGIDTNGTDVTIMGKEEEEETLDDKLKKLVNRSSIMLFMKGLPSMPRCGFSRQICEILNEHAIQYDAFDILGDEQVRQGLKTFSDWPTFPQLYVNGELVGGLDIVKELAENDELQDMLYVG